MTRAEPNYLFVGVIDYVQNVVFVIIVVAGKLLLL